MLFFIVLLIGVLVQQVSTTVYYVDVKRGAEGNDGKSLDEPLLTIQACVNALSEPGDECRVRYAMLERMTKPFTLFYQINPLGIYYFFRLFLGDSIPYVLQIN